MESPTIKQTGRTSANDTHIHCSIINIVPLYCIHFNYSLAKWINKVAEDIAEVAMDINETQEAQVVGCTCMTSYTESVETCFPSRQ